MTEKERKSRNENAPQPGPLAERSRQTDSPPAASAPGRPASRRRRAWTWWLASLFRAGLFLTVGVLLIVALGVAQRVGWISAGGGSAPTVTAGGAPAHQKTTHTCPMHPNIRQPGPGRCPICGMKLVPASEAGGGKGREDHLAVHIEPAARRVAGIRTAEAQTTSLSRTIRSVGEITYNESRLATIAAYVDGRIDKLFADYTGARVHRGQTLVELWSPDLYAAQQEYLLARKSASRTEGRSSSRTADLQTGILRQTRDKLIDLGMTEAQIDELARRNKAEIRLEIQAPIGGTVIERLASEGQYVKQGEPIYRIADLSTVWLMLELFPDEAARIRKNQEVTAKVQSLPGETFPGRVTFIDPFVDETTRTVGVRVEIPNPEGRLRPGDYATATIQTPVTSDGKPIAVVPRDAVLMAGEHSVVYVETEPGRFEIRPVTLGALTAEKAVIHEGITPGEKVATDGNFLIDSQMQLAGKPSVIDPSRAVERDRTNPGPLELQDAQPVELAGRPGRLIDRMYRAYFSIQSSLAGDRRPSQADVSTLQEAVEQFRQTGEATEDIGKSLAGLAEHAKQLRESGDIESAREAFRPISHAVLRLAARLRGPETADRLLHFYCPMVEGGGDWLQSGEPLANPYFGSKMLRCGEKVHEWATPDRLAVRPGGARK